MDLTSIFNKHDIFDFILNILLMMFKHFGRPELCVSYNIIGAFCNKTFVRCWVLFLGHKCWLTLWIRGSGHQPKSWKHQWKVCDDLETTLHIQTWYIPFYAFNMYQIKPCSYVSIQITIVTKTSFCNSGMSINSIIALRKHKPPPRPNSPSFCLGHLP